MNYEFARYHIEDLKPAEVLQYLRKSQSDDPSLTVDEVLQRHESILNEWAEKNLGALVPPENTYKEIVSGETIKDRPEINRVLQRIESPHIRAVSVVEPQRLSRGDLEDIGRLMKLFRYSNTLVITPTKIYNLQEKYDWDALERELKQGNDYLEYVKTILIRGRLRSVSEGNYVGSLPPYGYDKVWVRDGKKKYPTLRENKEQADIVRMVFDWYVNQNIGTVTIARKLDSMGVNPPHGEHWSGESIRCILSNPHCIGKVQWNGRKTVKVVENGEVIAMRPRAQEGDYLLFDGKHDAIVDESLFYAAQAKRGTTPKNKVNTQIRNPLAGLLYCQCGKAMTYRTYTQHTCAPRLACIDQTYCKTTSATFEEVYEQVKHILQQCIDDFELQLTNRPDSSVEMHDKLIHQLEKRLKELQNDEIKIWDERARNRGTDDEMPEHIFRELRERNRREQEATQAALN